MQRYVSSDSPFFSLQVRSFQQVRLLCNLSKPSFFCVCQLDIIQQELFANKHQSGGHPLTLHTTFSERVAFLPQNYTKMIFVVIFLRRFFILCQILPQLLSKPIFYCIIVFRSGRIYECKFFCFRQK